MSGFELLDKLQVEQSLHDIPIVVFTGQELSEDEQTDCRTAAKSVVIKNVQSPERLFDETALFLHRVIENCRKPNKKCFAGCTSPMRSCKAGKY